MMRAALLVLVFLAAAPATAAEGKPARIVSLNLCADELVLRLAGPGRVASVTYLARDPRGSNVADLAARVPVNRGLAEEVVPLAPDLVIAGAFTTRATTAMLRRLGFEVMELGVPATLEEAYAQIGEVAARLGEEDRGAAMVGEIKAAMAALPPAPADHPTAVVVRPNGFTAGRGSVPDEVLARAGLDNLAARLSTDRMGQLALEEIVTARPDLLVVNSSPDAPPSLADELLHHPALAPYAKGGRAVPLPIRLWACAGPSLAEAAQRLAAARAAIAPGAARPPEGHRQ
ncbi:ABC transporter substrate-binding protein [Xanthobacter pseudotagetidis]|uniref:ABC transporter substrate-binding protein n=1 Tax=Xanthobacter pseudotagetidis TaxID=3119911 RepID=UPI00372855E0